MIGIDKPVHGKCKWAFDDSTFLKWQQHKSNCLWISADAGCRKSVLLRAIMDEGTATNNDKITTTCYYFFRDDNVDRQNGAGALSAILRQFSVKSHAFYDMRCKTLKSTKSPSAQSSIHLYKCFT